MLTKFDKLPSVQVEDLTLVLELGKPSERSKVVAFKELREIPEIKAKALDDLRNLLEAETDLYCPRYNGDWLIRFLRPCKFYPKSARDLIKRHYAFKLKNAKICDELLPSKEANIFKHNIITVLYNRDQLGRRIVITEQGSNWKYNEVTLDEMFKGIMIYMEAFTLEPDTQISGTVGIFDMDGMTLKHTMRFTPTILKRLTDYFQESTPLRLKAMHIVYQPKVFEVVYSVFKKFLNKKMASRIFFHGTDMASLHKHIAPECLPAKYGGTAVRSRIDSKDWYQLLLQYEQEFEALNTYGYKRKILN